MISFNFLGLRYFGEAEFYFCMIKGEVFTFAPLHVMAIDGLQIPPVSLMIGLIIAGLVITLGGGPDRT